MTPAMSASPGLARAAVVQLLKRLSGGTVRVRLHGHLDQSRLVCLGADSPKGRVCIRCESAIRRTELYTVEYVENFRAEFQVEALR